MRFSFKRLISIVKKEFIQIKRDKISLRIPIVMPIMMMLLFGYVVNTEVDNVLVASFDQSKTMESREYLQTFHNSGYFEMAYSVESEEELVRLVDSGMVKAGIYIPVGFASDLKAGRNTQVQFVLDGADPTVARTALYSGLLVSSNYSQVRMDRVLREKGLSRNIGSVDFISKVWYNPNLDNHKFNIPGLVGLILQNVTVMLTAFSLVREKERGTIEQLIVTPIRSNELLVGKLIPYIFIGYVGFLFALCMCVFWFGVSVEGNIGHLLLLGALFVICALAMGMFISTMAKNQLQAMMATMIVLLPSILLSGFMFPVDAMPEVIQPLTALIPLTYFLNIVRGVITKGVGFEYLVQDALALCVFLVVIMTIAIKKFKKSLD